MIPKPLISDLVPGYAAETDLERTITREGELLQGLAWRVHHPGHPERCIGHHVAAILDGISAMDPLRADLRLIALVHDSFKHRVDPSVGYSRDNDHAVLAARFAARFVSDPRILIAIELHDELYWRWHNGATDLDAVLTQVPATSLYLQFVQLDASTEGKDPSFLWWLRHELAARGLLPANSSPVFDRRTYIGDEVIYLKTFETAASEQTAVARAAAEVVAAEADVLGASGEVLQSQDGLRVLLLWRWRGSSTEPLRRDGDIVRRALRAHPELARATPKEAHLFAAFPPREVGSRTSRIRPTPTEPLCKPDVTMARASRSTGRSAD